MVTAARQRGLLLSFEGSEGSGKTTQIARLARRFEALGRQVLVTREPGGTPLGEQVRHLLKHAPQGAGMCPEAELLLFAASRAQLVREVLVPALDAGKVVLCDRFLDSTTVYQGVGRRLAADPVAAINAFAVGDVRPRVTVVLDVPAEVGLRRASLRPGAAPDRMEQENLEFYAKVREGYLLLARSLPDRFLVIDGTPPEDVVAETLWRELDRRLA